MDAKPDTIPTARAAAPRRREPGARRLQILQTLAAMLEDPRGEKVTTAALAAKLSVSEAALYRHFASKAQMFEGLIEFIENSVFGLINDIAAREASGLRQVRAIVLMLLEFAQANRGMTRVLIGDALVNEHDRLQERMNQFMDRVEASIRQSYRVAISREELPPQFDAAARAALVTAFVVGRWHRFAKSGFRRAPAENVEAQLPALLV
ncbi:MAG: nucleoid occlusion factor SlmA [Burkholderiaceae bacterium]|nr:nucleoid occlusion factor SlmA [Burkholderiaceae bacterium]MCX8004238.1 nucleoid occlusion factor SlmA [Burkholderiaceae bacterium]